MKFIAAFGLFILALVSPLSLAKAQEGMACVPTPVGEAVLEQQLGLKPTTPRLRQPSGDQVQIWASENGDRVFVALYVLHPEHGSLMCKLAYAIGLTASAPEI